MKGPQLFLTCILSMVMITTASCRKKGDTLVEVKVHEPDGKLSENCMVILYGQQTVSEPNLGMMRIDTAFTNTVGVAMFDYTDDFQLGQAGFTVLDILASKDTLEGTSAVQIEPEATTKVSVYLNLAN